MGWQILPALSGNSDDPLKVVREIELGWHTLFIMSDDSIDLVDFEGKAYLAENAVNLPADETYKLYISLHEHFQAQRGVTK